jgi:hypothetical protein
MIDDISVRTAPKKRSRPEPSWVCGTCPECGEVMVVNYYHVGGRGYLGYRECWASLGDQPTCHWSQSL